MWKRLLLAVVVVFTTVTVRADTITVAAAISLKEAVTQAATDFTAQTGHKVEFNFGSSGQLATQIVNGAPVDVFISAGRPQITQLEKAQLTQGPSVVITGNQLVLIAPADSKLPIKQLSEVTDPGVKRLAVGQPETVPAGLYAQQALTKLNVYDTLKDRLVLGANVRQVLDYVIRGEADAGLVYATDAAAVGPKVKVLAQVDPTLHATIEYPAVIIKDSKQAATATAFVAFLQSPAGQKIFTDKGYVAPAVSATRPATQPAKSGN
ncbi:MAG: molybdate ABC transporter substrate-binding protein [Phycisphaerae bacterium]